MYILTSSGLTIVLFFVFSVRDFDGSDSGFRRLTDVCLEIGQVFSCVKMGVCPIHLELISFSAVPLLRTGPLLLFSPRDSGSRLAGYCSTPDKVFPSDQAVFCGNL